MKRSACWLLAAAVGLPGLAFADYEEHPIEGEKPASKGSMEVQANAGVTTYAGGAADLTQPGFAYGVSVSGQVAPLVDAEIGYLGSVYSSERLVTNDKSTLVENGGQALAKVGPSLGHLEPYALGGINISRITVGDEQATGGLVQDSTAVRIPVGVGFDYKLKSEGSGLTLGARGTYSFSTNNNSFPTAGSTNAQATWMGLAAVGGSF